MSESRRKIRDRHLTPAEVAAERDVRKELMEEFPPKKKSAGATPGRIATALRSAREQQGMTWYAVAKQAGIPNPNTVRDLEQSTADAQLSTVAAIAEVLGLQLDLVPKSL